MTPDSVSFCTRWRTAASLRPTALPISAYERRPSVCSCSMIAFETSSSATACRLAVRTGSCLDSVSRARALTSESASNDRRFPFEIGRRELFSAPHRPGTVGAMAELKNFIDGDVRRARRATVASTSSTPRPRRRYATSPSPARADVDAAFTAAAAAFEEWGETTPAERQLALFRIADAMEARADEFADLESQDTGKPRGYARGRRDPALGRPDPVLRGGGAPPLEGRRPAST